MVRLIFSIAAVFCLGLPAAAAVWPEQWGDRKLTQTEPAVVADPDLWAEFQGEASETASYRGAAGIVRATAWRLLDATSALAWYQHIRPENCASAPDSFTLCTAGGARYVQKIPPVAPGSAPSFVTGTSSAAQYMVVKNYVLAFEGWRPRMKDVEALEALLPNTRSGGGLPQLPTLLPEKGRVRNSERYVMGIHSLTKYEPRIPAILAGFEDGAEAEVARFNTPAGEVALTLFYYPSPQLARKYQPGFEKQPGFVVKRSGTMIAVVPGGHDPAKLEGILSPVEWHISFIWNQATKALPMPDVAGMLIGIFELTGLLLVVCIGGGLAFAGFWILLRRRQNRLQGTDSNFIALHIGD